MPLSHSLLIERLHLLLLLLAGRLQLRQLRLVLRQRPHGLVSGRPRVCQRLLVRREALCKLALAVVTGLPLGLGLLV